MSFEAYNLYWASEKMGAAASSLLRLLPEYKPDEQILHDREVAGHLNQILEQVDVVVSCLPKPPEVMPPQNVPTAEGTAYEAHRAFAHQISYYAATIGLIYANEGYPSIFRGEDLVPGQELPRFIHDEYHTRLLRSVLELVQVMVLWRHRCGALPLNRRPPRAS